MKCRLTMFSGHRRAKSSATLPAMKYAGMVSGGMNTRTAPGNTIMADSIVFVGEPDISRLSRFMETTGWRLIKRGENDEKKNRGIHSRNGSVPACNNRLLSGQPGMEDRSGARDRQYGDDRSGYQDDEHPGNAEGKRIPV